MKDGASKSFEQAYNCQIASDEHAQIIVGTNVTQETNDKQQVQPVLEDVKERPPQREDGPKASNDTGPGHVRQTQADCRTGVRADQRAPGLSTLFTAGPGQRHF